MAIGGVGKGKKETSAFAAAARAKAENPGDKTATIGAEAITDEDRGLKDVADVATSVEGPVSGRARRCRAATNVSPDQLLRQAVRPPNRHGNEPVSSWPLLHGAISLL